MRTFQHPSACTGNRHTTHDTEPTKPTHSPTHSPTIHPPFTHTLMCFQKCYHPHTRSLTNTYLFAIGDA
eukprot:m.372066 g.372066  ORF g.372066 m.372066 type:complete len:69 (+) comp61965_c0_seq1:147-353(+)